MYTDIKFKDIITACLGKLCFECFLGFFSSFQRKQSDGASKMQVVSECEKIREKNY